MTVLLAGEEDRGLLKAGFGGYVSPCSFKLKDPFAKSLCVVHCH